ncbi:MAG: hypothetical protein RQ949_02585 [Candidatus Calditenuis sp.]|jgi:hypothetical protein|nr:hypothetical protein [Candidatus Calditenuis sp.]
MAGSATLRGTVTKLALGKLGELPAVKITVATPDGRSSDYYVADPPDWLEVGVRVEGSFREVITTRGARRVVESIRRADAGQPTELEEVEIRQVTFPQQGPTIVEGVTGDGRVFSVMVEDPEVVEELRRGLKRSFALYVRVGAVRRLIALLPYKRTKLARRVRELLEMIEASERSYRSEEAIRLLRESTGHG